MRFFRGLYLVAILLAVSACALAGCGVTRSTDTNRTATEQLLVSDAIDRAVQQMDLRALAGQTVYLDDTKLADTVDKNYLISTIRQYLLANGCQLRDKKEEADFIVEARAGAVGTDRNDLLFGVPSFNVPQIPVVQPVGAVIPEIPIAKRKDQRGVAKIAVFAYHRQTGKPVWQSGLVREESSANDVWILGAGPFQHGTIYQGTEFAGSELHDETHNKVSARRLPPVGLAQQNLFNSPQQFAKQQSPGDQKVVQASHTEAAKGTTPAATPAAGSTAAASATTPTPAKPATPQTVATPVPTPPAPVTPAVPPTPPTVAPPPPGLSASVDPAKPQNAASAYLQTGDASALPQPRFNSPK